MYSEKQSFGEKVGDWFRHILSCCDKEQEEEARPALQISGPTNFRREDISIPGLDPEQQAFPSLSLRQHFIRTKAISDAQKLYAHLQPLRSSPSGHFATPTSPKMPTYEEFTTPRSHATPTMERHTPTTPLSKASHGSALDSTLEKVKRHSRKISNSIKGPNFGGAYHPVGSEKGEGRYEMRSLMDPSESRVVDHRVSGESFSVGGSELEQHLDAGMLEMVELGDGDSGKIVKI